MEVFLVVSSTLIYKGLIYFFDINWLSSYFITVNLMTFIFYGYDKLIAGTDAYRVPEALLHLLALFGGSPTATLCQWFFRHKIRKKEFQIAHWIIIIVHIFFLSRAIQFENIFNSIKSFFNSIKFF